MSDLAAVGAVAVAEPQQRTDGQAGRGPDLLDEGGCRGQGAGLALAVVAVALITLAPRLP